MMPTLRLRTRLLSAYALLILVGFGGLAWLAGTQIADFAQQDAAQTLEAHTALMARSLSRELYQLGEEDNARPCPSHGAASLSWATPPRLLPKLMQLWRCTTRKVGFGTTHAAWLAPL